MRPEGALRLLDDGGGPEDSRDILRAARSQLSVEYKYKNIYIYIYVYVHIYIYI